MAWVDSTDSVVLVVANECHVVSFLVHPLPVEVLLGNECSLYSESGEVRGRTLDVVTEVLTIARTIDPLFPDVLADVGVCLSLEGDFDDFGGKRCELSLVLHEGANTSLLIPDEQVLLSCSCVHDRGLKLLEAVRGPRVCGLISFDHFSMFVCVCVQ